MRENANQPYAIELTQLEPATDYQVVLAEANSNREPVLNCESALETSPPLKVRPSP